VSWQTPQNSLKTDFAFGGSRPRQGELASVAFIDDGGQG
jgi:hypothetical protein